MDNFRGDKIFVVEQYLVIDFSWILFSWLELALQVKVGKVSSFVGKIFVVRPSTIKTTNILPHENYPLYGISVVFLNCLRGYFDAL